MNKIVFLPLDERPCNYLYPEYIGKISGSHVVLVPRNLMGDFKRPADIEGIWEWTQKEAADASVLIVSMDLFLYGGIVPSRLHHFSEEECLERVERLKLLKEKNPSLKIYAFQLITRAPARDGSGEEPDYYENYGYRIFRYGVLRDKENLRLISEEEKAEKARIEQEVPKEALDDFLNRRKVNFNNNKHSIDLLAEGVLDFLIIPLDDCRENGYAPAERRMLASYARSKELFSKVYFYPGADETGCTLLARAVNETGTKAPSVYVDYSSIRGKYQIPSYEDRSIGETVQYQLLTAGCGIAETSAEADAVLVVNPPTVFSLRLEKELITDEIFLESERNFHALVERMRKYISRGQICAVADCAIPNMADRALMQFLYEQDLLDKIDAYAGWNTSSNTLGTVIAHLSACHSVKGGEKSPVSKEFLFFRYLEDWGYMGEVRRKVTERLPEIDPHIHALDLGDKEPEVRKIVKGKLEEFQRHYFPKETWNFDLRMPWNRMFEIEITIE